ncbi:unnamed protein product [Prorocentrum cordatum]|uniref:ISXO2-like transposase domain-containing protein n=1 Tax=Prorocentrum cordatum TaxID=2364126 RepID=A0ABN9TDK4_9DINO|nr:unnamed protein product [Polarella glacialis]
MGNPKPGTAAYEKKGERNCVVDSDNTAAYDWAICISSVVIRRGQAPPTSPCGNVAAINPAVVLPGSLGTSLGLPGYAPGLTFGESLQHIENMKANDHPCVHVSRLDTAGQCAIADLPAQFATECSKMIVHFADYLGDYEGDIPWGTLRDCAKTCDFKNTPEPFSLKKEPPGQYSMQAFVIKKPDGKHDILKDVNLLGVSTRTDSCLQMCRGTGLIWRYGIEFRVGRLAVQHMLEKLEGYQLRYHTVVAKPGKGPSRKTAEWELKAAGYKFTREKGPRTNNANQFMEFADRESCRPESPTFGWEEGRVERALNNYAKGRADAKGLAIWIPTLRDFEPWFLNNVIKPILEAVGFQDEPGGAMAQHADIKEYREELRKADIISREDFLRLVKHARVADTGAHANVPSLLALIFAKVMGFISDKCTCPCCGGNDYEVVHRKDKSAWAWRCRDWSGTCDSCKPESHKSMTKGTVFEGVQCKSWMDLLDVTTTWLFDYPKRIMGRESGSHHCVIDMWGSTFQTKVASALHAAMASNGYWPKTSKKPKRKRGAQAKSRARVRAVAKAAAPRRNAGVGLRKKSEIKNYKIVVQVDEAHLNKRKPGRLARAARPQKDQVRVWGATVQGRPDVWLFRVPDHPLDAFKCKPRGHDEMLTSMHLLGLKKGTALVSDSWGATISAVKEFKKLKRWTVKGLRRELVAHSAGEIVNPNGFATNGIEAVWSVVKRWVRRRCGGRMPSHSGREQRRALLAELQWRKMNAHKTLDWGNAYFVPFAALAAACKPLE